MLRGCLHVLRRAAAQQLPPGQVDPASLASLSCAALSCGGRQLVQLQQSLLSALQLSRPYTTPSDGSTDGSKDSAAAAAAGSAGSTPPLPPAAAAAAGASIAEEEEQGGEVAAVDAGEALGIDLQDHDQVLAEWGLAMEEGDWDRAWDIFESAFPVDTGEFPQLEELLAWDPDAQGKDERRARELALQEAMARSRVQKLDLQGRSRATGKRKTSIARVWLKPGAGHIMVNKRPFDAYFPALMRRNDVITPFVVTDTLGEFDVMVNVRGGGSTGQAQAVRHGISRALQLFDPELRPMLKVAGLLTRDSRIVERKKYGRKKARKAFQWVKR